LVLSVHQPWQSGWLILNALGRAIQRFLSRLLYSDGRVRGHSSHGSRDLQNWCLYTPSTGRVLLVAIKMLFMGAKGRWHINPLATYRHMNDGTFWESIKPSKIQPAARPKWMTFDDAWVNELQRRYAACNVFLWYPLYWLAYDQLMSSLTNQANTMDVKSISPDVFGTGNLDPFTLIVLIPFCDLVL
jgi:proton-dependent oligopeptide transporter, POT family